MYENDSIYKQLNQEKKPIEFSRIGIIPTDDSYTLTAEKIARKLLSDNRIDLKDIAYYPIKNFEHYKIELLFENQFYYCIIHETKNIKEFVKKLPKATHIKEEHLEKAYNSAKIFHINVMFNRDVLSSYLFQLCLGKILIDDATMLIDFSSRMLFSIDWLKQMVEVNIPPAPSSLFSINEMTDPLYNTHWFFTKGLLRCGSPDIEMINIRHNIKEMRNMIGVVGESFVTGHYCENKPITIGYDGLDLNILWKRWESEINKISKEVIDGVYVKDRLADDWGASGILYALEDKTNIMSPEIYGSTLKNNPVIYIKDEETKRMKNLALSRFNLFEKTYIKHLKLKKRNRSMSIWKNIFRTRNKKTNDNIKEWGFRVKLGFSIDITTTDYNSNQKEYLWFDVCNIEKDNIRVRLLNVPYWIKVLKKDKIYSFSIKKHLIDWIIFSPKTIFNPDSAFALEYELSSNNTVK